MLDLFETTWQDLWAGHDTREPVGAVFTRPEIVELILDLAGYSVGRTRLATLRVLEPSCGDGAFVTLVVARLVESERQQAGLLGWDDPVLDDALRAVDISEISLARARRDVGRQLAAAGCPEARARGLTERWFVRTDFLLHEWDHAFDVVVGNPPYVRIEDLPKRVLTRYRSLYATTGDRADLYVAFIERGLQLLSQDGVLGLITANRFAKNLYGRKLRRLIAEHFRVRYYLNLEHTQPFLTDVSAYPAILVADRERGLPTRASTLETIEPGFLEGVRRQALSPERPHGIVSEFSQWYPDGGPWLATCNETRNTLDSLRRTLPTLEESAPGTRVGIGVATGADQVFILKERSPFIEADRQIPLAVARDVSNREISWSGHFLVDPFNEDGSLVNLAAYPGLAGHLDRNAEALKRRHVARQRPQAWYRTIDRIWPDLQHRPKVLIPDIQSADAPTVGYDEGLYYPHHNLYWITSESWNLQALKALLRSSRVIAQVRAYSVQMRGGSLRWQAQTLRKVRIPSLSSLPDRLVEELVAVAESSQQAEIDSVAEQAFS